MLLRGTLHSCVAATANLISLLHKFDRSGSTISKLEVVVWLSGISKALMIAFYCTGATPQPPLRTISRSNLAAFSRQAFILTQSEFLGGSLALQLIGPISNQETNSPTYYIIENETHLAYFDLLLSS